MTVRAEETEAGPVRRTLWRGRTLAILLAAAGVAIFLAANAHFLYVAVMSQPDCVAHNKEAGTGVAGATYRAAKSAC